MDGGINFQRQDSGRWDPLPTIALPKHLALPPVMQEATKERDVFDHPPDDGGRVDDTEADAYTGVKTVEAAEKVYGKYSKWLLYLGYVASSNQIPTPN